MENLSTPANGQAGNCQIPRHGGEYLRLKIGVDEHDVDILKVQENGGTTLSIQHSIRLKRQLNPTYPSLGKSR